MSKYLFARSFLSLLLIASISLLNVNTVLADDTVPPPATAEPTEPPLEETPTPSEEPSAPIITETPIGDETPINGEQLPAESGADASGPFSQIPENTDVVVLDENGNSLPLATEDALNIILETDPMWCPANVPPGGAGCTTNFASIALLINNMIANTNAYDQAGVIYFTSNPGASFSLTTTSLGTADFNQLRDNNLVLQGGWNGQNGVNATFTGQTNFGNNSVTIGTSASPWIGNITLNNFSFSGVSSTNAVTVYTTSGNILLSNVDVSQQTGNNYTANLVSTSGNITVQNGSTFDGDNTGSDTNRGFNAQTSSGSITITGTVANPITFTDAEGNGNGTNYNGATLSASTVTLTNVSAYGNDLNGIYISNANTVNLNNVIGGTDAVGNGTNPPGNNNSVGSGVYIQGPAGGSIVSINGGYFAENERYGIEIHNGTVTIISAPSYGTGGNASAYGPTYPNTAPSLNVPNDITVEATSSSGNVVTFSVTASDAEDNPDPTPICNHTSGSVFPIATTTVTCSVTDSWGVVMSDSFTVRVRDTAGPVLSLPANITAEATGSNGRAVTFTATATDLVDGPRTVTCIPGSGSTFPIGTTNVTCWSFDSRANLSIGGFSVTVRDTTPPTLNLPANIIVEATGPSGRVVTYTVTATDLVNGNRPVTCAPLSNLTYPIGTTTVNCSSSDTRGNTSNGSFMITVRDTTPPVIAAHTNLTVEATSAAGAAITYTSPSTSDVVDGTGIATCSPVSGSTFAVGTNTVTCNATDAHGNSATPTTFTVIVQDTTAPILNLPSNMTVEATSAAGANVTYSASASDLVDASVIVNCSPASGSTFVLGTTSVNCSGADDSGNTANGSFNITVQDTTAPSLSLPANITLEATGPTGAVVTYSASALDLVSGSVLVSCSPVSGSTFAVGTTTVNCSAADTAGNTGNGSFTITVQDTTVPSLILPANITQEATSAAGATVNYSASALDIVDGVLPVSCSVASGNIFALGVTTVNCSATDSQNNVSSGSFTVTIQDTTAPVIAPKADIETSIQNAFGSKQINYTPPSTTDIVDGTGTASCTPASNGIFKPGETKVTCTAVDAHGNAAKPITFMIGIKVELVTPVTTSIIPVTGGETIELDCNTKLMLGNIKVIFYNLCDQQALLTSEDVNTLPGNLPAGFTFVAGLNVNVLDQGQVLDQLPAGAGIEMDFPTSQSGQFAVLFWDGGKWVEATQSLNDADVTKALSDDASNELYKLASSGNGKFKTLTTENIGTFVLVKK